MPGPSPQRYLSRPASTCPAQLPVPSETLPGASCRHAPERLPVLFPRDFFSGILLLRVPLLSDVSQRALVGRAPDSSFAFVDLSPALQAAGMAVKRVDLTQVCFPQWGQSWRRIRTWPVSAIAPPRFEESHLKNLHTSCMVRWGLVLGAAAWTARRSVLPIPNPKLGCDGKIMDGFRPGDFSGPPNRIASNSAPLPAW